LTGLSADTFATIPGAKATFGVPHATKNARANELTNEVHKALKQSQGLVVAEGLGERGDDRQQANNATQEGQRGGNEFEDLVHTIIVSYREQSW
jgi:hypothetical protein